MRFTSNSLTVVSGAVLSASLVACGGGGSSSTTSTAAPGPVAAAPAPAPAVSSAVTLTGIAATGAALSGATITLIDANGVLATRVSDASGAYSFDATALTAPFVLTASALFGDTKLTMTSVLATKPAAGTTGTANITPLTQAMAALLAPNGNPDELVVPSVLRAVITTAKVDDASARVKAAIDNVLRESGLDPARFDPVSTTFAANRTGADRVLELIRVEVTGQGVSLSNPTALDNGSGSASVQITPATTLAAVAKVPASPLGTVLGELDHLAALADLCFADAPAVRVTARSATGVATASSPACTALPFASTYKSAGLNSLQRYNTILQSADLTGAKFSKPEKLYTTAAGTAVFRMAYRTAAGAGGVLTDVAQQTNPLGRSYTWQIVGNQRDFDSAVDVRLDNLNQLNPVAGQSESNKSQYRVAFRLYFNPINTAGLNVQAVRVKGPGLPATGVVMHRSSVCGTNDYMTVTNKTGGLINSTGRAISFNSNTSNSFKVAAELKTGAFDWTKVAGNSSWRETPLTDAELAAIPSFAEYTWELWTFGAGRAYRADITNATAADLTYTQRASSRAPSVGSLRGLPWNSIDASDFLSPVTSLAAEQSTATVNWRATAEPVDMVSAFGQRNVAATAAVPASFLRVSADTSVKISDTFATVTPANDAAGTASLVGVAGLTVAATNCAAAKFPVLDAVVGTKDTANSYATYRDMTVRSRAYSLARKYVTNSWSNFID